MWATVNDHTLPGPSATPNTSQWQQCPNQTWTTAAGASIDTRGYVASAGPLTLGLNAINAAQVTSAVSETLQVDNGPIGVALSTPDDPNPSLWVNHAVTVNAKAAAGPSGMGGMNCNLDGGKAAAYPAAGVSVNGSGVHTVSCTAWNRVIDPQGNPNTGSAAETIHIDETPPTVALAPEDPSNPTQLIANTSDGQSGVGGGSIQMAPSGTQNWTRLPTSFDGSHLIASINDSGLSGPYTLQATSCDNVGNCASTDETLTLPLRLSDVSDVSFAAINSPAKIVRERVLVGWHYTHERVRRHGKLRRIRIRAGGHYRRVRMVIPTNTSCATTHIKTGRHRWREVTACRVLKLKLKTKRRVRFGHKTTVHGLLITSQGAPIADVPVTIETAPDNGSGQFTPVAAVTTSSTGGWSATLPAGPSRIIHAVYGGSAMILPATGQATLIVPAKIRITSIQPRHIPWGATIKITGQLFGGYLPPGGALVELRYGYGHAQTVYGVKTHVTRKRFTTTFTFGPGQTPLTFGFQIATLPGSQYPYAPASSNIVNVDVGGSTTNLPSLGTSSPKHHHKASKHKPKRHRAKTHKAKMHHHKKKKRRTKI